MNIKLRLILVSVMLIAVSSITRAQCPQICDGNAANTALGNNALPGDTGNSNTAVGDSVSLTIAPAARTRPAVFTHYLTTPPATTTRPVVFIP